MHRGVRQVPQRRYAPVLRKAGGDSVSRQDDVNITDPGFFASGDPMPILAKWRASDPVHWTQGSLSRGFWSVTRHADVMQVFMNDNRIFSIQRYGASLPQNEEMDDIEKSVFMRLIRSGANLSVMDGEPHVVLRRAFNEHFSVGGIAALETLIRDCTTRILNDVLPRGACDFTVDIAGRLPLAVISAMMDIPEKDWEDLYRWNNMSAAPEDPEWSVGTPLETSQEGTSKLVGYCAELAMQRRGGQGNDLLSVLARTEVDGELLPPEKLGFNGLMFFAAGHETTRAALSSALLELMRDPAQWRALRERRHDPAAIKAVAEEGVRWASPLTHTLRTATENTVIGDQQIKEGDWVVAWLISANRDEAAFTDAHRFDSARTPNNHLGFAIGKHHCLGAHLARAEMRILLEQLLEVMPEPPELVGDAQMAASTLFWGIKHMPIRFPPRPGLTAQAAAR